jgi:hypothetical protein
MPTINLFLSHTWARDEMNRDTHERVAKIKDALILEDISVWFDENQMVHNIDNAMANGIEACDFVLVFLTCKYCNKVNKAASNPSERDNCYKEFSYAQIMKKIIVPIAFEPSMASIDDWPNGIVKLHLGPQLYVDAATCSAQEATVRILELITKLKRLSNNTPYTPVPPTLPRKLSNTRKSPRHRTAPKLPIITTSNGNDKESLVSKDYLEAKTKEKLKMYVTRSFGFTRPR